MTPRTRRTATSAVLAGLLLVAGTARAETDAARADALFREGQAAAAQRDFKTALDKFRSSLELDPSPGTLLNIGDAEEQLGRILSASQHYKEFLKAAASGDKRAVYAQERITALATRVPLLTIELEQPTPEGTRVSIDGAAVDATSLGGAQPLEPGEHEVLVASPGRTPKSFRVTLREGERRSLQIAVSGSSPSEAPQPAATQQTTAPAGDEKGSGLSSRTLGFVIGGIGAAALVGSGVSVLLMSSSYSDVKDQCNATTKVCDSQSGVDAAESARTWSTVGAVTFAAGAVGIGIGAYFLFSGGKDEKPATALRIGPRAGGGTIDVVGRF